jgi:hypothetical protein
MKLTVDTLVRALADATAIPEDKIRKAPLKCASAHRRVFESALNLAGKQVRQKMNPIPLASPPVPAYPRAGK